MWVGMIRTESSAEFRPYSAIRLDDVGYRDPGDLDYEIGIPGLLHGFILRYEYGALRLEKLHHGLRAALVGRLYDLHAVPELQIVFSSLGTSSGGTEPKDKDSHLCHYRHKQGRR